MFILSNIVLKNNLPKIIDFGPGEGTVGYQSPELLGRLKYDGKTDIWSAGCVIFEIIFLKKYSLIMDDRSFNEMISGKLSILLKS